MMYYVLSKLCSKGYGSNIKIATGRYAVKISAGLSGYISFHMTVAVETAKGRTLIQIRYWELLEEYSIHQFVNFSFFYFLSLHFHKLVRSTGVTKHNAWVPIVGKGSLN
jgi:hypothetical protein